MRRTLPWDFSAQGQIEEGDDDDYFRVQVTEAGTLTVYTTGSLDTLGELQASDGSSIASNDDGGYGLNFRIEHDVGPGAYHVGVSSYGTATGDYVVLASFVTEVLPLPPHDHGDTRSDATDLALGSAVRGQIEQGDDDDYFRVQVTEPGTLAVYTTGSLDTLGELQASDGSSIASDDDDGEGRNFRIEHDVDPGAYYVRVSSHGANTGDYVVQASFDAEEVREPTTPDIPIVLTGSAPTTTINLSDYFSIPDGGSPAYEVVSSDPAVVTVSESAGLLTFSMGGGGTATVSLTIRFSVGRTVMRRFSVTANPQQSWGPVSAVPNQTMRRDKTRIILVISQFFSSPPTGVLSFSVTSNNTELVTARLGPGDLLTLSPKKSWDPQR